MSQVKIENDSMQWECRFHVPMLHVDGQLAQATRISSIALIDRRRVLQLRHSSPFYAA